MLQGITKVKQKEEKELFSLEQTAIQSSSIHDFLKDKIFREKKNPKLADSLTEIL